MYHTSTSAEKEEAFMKPKKDFLYALDQAKEVVQRLCPADMSRPTPDTEWDVGKLFHHMLYELCWVPDMVMGETIAVVGDRYEGDIVGGNPIAAWRTAAVAAREAVRRCDPNAVVHLSYGDRQVRDYLCEAAVDQLVHTWDLGQAVGIPVVFEEAVSERMYAHMLPRKQELVDSGLFAAALAVPDTVSYQTKLLALLGRSLDWHRG